MSDQLDKKSILEMSMGAILERVDYEMGKVMDNILDPNTKATAELMVAEMVPQVPGQLALDGEEQDHPKILKFKRQA